MPFPLPAEALRRSAVLGRRLAVAARSRRRRFAGVTTGALAARRSRCWRSRGRWPAEVPLRDDDLKLTAGWGYRGQGGAVMPGQGLVRAREYTERRSGRARSRRIGALA